MSAKHIRLEYAHEGLIGLLTPQANTTVEPEMSILLPRGFAAVTARLVSPKASIEDRQADYARSVPKYLEQFGNAPLDTLALAVTGVSYQLGIAKEDALVAEVSGVIGAPFVTAARAICATLATLEATTIGLVSPYPPEITSSSAAYWRERGLTVSKVIQLEAPEGAFHPIYALSSSDVSAALDQASLDGLDAVVLLGTGLPTLASIAAWNPRQQPPVVSSMLCLAWECMGEASRRARTRSELRAFLAGEQWRTSLNHT